MKVRSMAAVGVLVGAALSGAPDAGALSTQGPLPPGANVFVDLAKKVVPSVVHISTFSTAEPMNQMSPEDFFRWYFEDFFNGPGGRRGPMPGVPGAPRGGGERERRPLGLGTGFIIDAEGLILTNNHVVGGADEIKIRFTEDESEDPSDGEVIGRDTDLDLALVKVKTKRKLTPVTFGDSDSLEVGEYVMAVGSPFGRGHSLSHGIISAKGRAAPGLLARYLQTDAPINPGNSGGPLVNLSGEVIGINNAIDARAQGIGFAIPISLVKNVLPQLRTKGKVDRGYIGVLVGELTPELAERIGAPKDASGAFITHVMPGEPAQKAGVEPYDVVLAVNGTAVRSTYDMIQEITRVPVGEKAALKILRDGDERTIKVAVKERPSPGDVATAGPGGAPRGEERPGKSASEAGMDVREITPQLARSLGLDPGAKGVVVEGVGYGGPADKAGIARGDVILEVDRKPVASVTEFEKAVKGGKSYLVRIRRTGPDGSEQFQVVVLDLKKTG